LEKPFNVYSSVLRTSTVAFAHFRYPIRRRVHISLLFDSCYIQSSLAIALSLSYFYLSILTKSDTKLKQTTFQQKTKSMNVLSVKIHIFLKQLQQFINGIIVFADIFLFPNKKQDKTNKKRTQTML
jgi:hypothetical protein